VLTQAADAVVHHRGDLGQVGLAAWVRQPRDPSGTGATWLREQRTDARTDPGVQDGGDVLDAVQVAGGDGGSDDVGRV
jgi:hypothetical protein